MVDFLNAPGLEIKESERARAPPPVCGAGRPAFPASPSCDALRERVVRSSTRLSGYIYALGRGGPANSDCTSPDMRVAPLFSVAIPLFAQAAKAANAFAGSNLYYAAGLTQDERTTLLK